MPPHLRAFLVTALSAVVCLQATALPRFSSRAGAKCQSCHVNPSGGSMRQAFGVQYGRETLPVPGWSDDIELEDFTNLLTNFLGVGADFRTLYYYAKPANGAATNTFFQMQGDLYLNLRVAKRVNMYLKKGLREGFEVFGLLNLLPANGHAKVGMFTPNFGTKLDDHTAYVRTYTGFSQAIARPERAGLEIGVSPGWFSAFAGVYNATQDLSSSAKAFLGRAEGLFALGEKAHVGIGGNLYSTRSSSDVKQLMYGGFGAASYGDLSLLGEADWIQSEPATGRVTGLVVYAELDYVVTPGVDLKAAYDFYDEDTALKTGATTRYSFGLEFFPLVGVELRPMYRIIRQEVVSAQETTTSTSNEVHVLLHFYF